MPSGPADKLGLSDSKTFRTLSRPYPYKDDELREFVKTERLRLEKEKQIQFDKEEKEREVEKLRFEAQKIEANRAEKQ